MAVAKSKLLDEVLDELLIQVSDDIEHFTADSAYDETPVYRIAGSGWMWEVHDLGRAYRGHRTAQSESQAFPLAAEPATPIAE